MVDIHLRTLRLGEKKDRDKKKPQGKNIMACPITSGGHKNLTSLTKEIRAANFRLLANE